MADDPTKNNEGETIPKATYDAVAEKLRTRTAEIDELKKQLDGYKQKETAEEEEKRKKAGEFEKIIEDQKKANDQLKQSLVQTRREVAITKVAQKLGAKDANDLITLLADKVTVSEDGAVDEAAVEKLAGEVKTSKPYLFGEAPKPNVGDPGGAPPGGNPDKPTFTRSQIADRKFYIENRDKILEAQREGRITDDIASPGEAK